VCEPRDRSTKDCEHWRNFTLKSGGDQWRRQHLVSGGHDDRGAEGVSIEAPKAPSGVRYGEGFPLPSRLRGLRQRRELPSGVRGRATAAIAFSAYFRPQNASGSFWWRQSPPLSKVVVTSHNRHIQSCAYDCVICYMYFYSVWSVTAGGGVAAADS